MFSIPLKGPFIFKYCIFTSGLAPLYEPHVKLLSCECKSTLNVKFSLALLFQVNRVRTRDLDCCLTVPLIMEAGDSLDLVISRNPLAAADTGLPDDCDQPSNSLFCFPEHMTSSIALWSRREDTRPGTHNPTRHAQFSLSHCTSQRDLHTHVPLTEHPLTCTNTNRHPPPWKHLSLTKLQVHVVHSSRFYVPWRLWISPPPFLPHNTRGKATCRVI